MIKQIVSASTGMAVWAAVAAGVARPQADLIASVEFASFADVQQKVADLGTTINNPVVSMMAIPALQNALTEKFGNFRSDAPMKFLCYADVATLRRALETDALEGLEDAFEPVFLFPSADGAAKFLVNHPEAEKKEDGTIALEDGTLVLFAADGRTCAFANKAETAKRALASALAPAASRPLLRAELTQVGVDLLADLHQKMLKESNQTMAAQGEIVSMLVKIQQASALRQNAMLRKFARVSMSLDLDQTGFVTKGEAMMRPGVAVSPAAGFKLPAGALDALPADAPLFGALNTWNASGFQSEDEYRAFSAEVCAALDAVPASLGPKCPPACATAVKDLCSLTRDYIKAVPIPAPTDWSACAFAFGPKKEPYMTGTVECANLPQVLAAYGQFCSAVVAAIGKSWPGILSASGTRLTIDWNRLVDVVDAAVAGPNAPQGNAAEKAQVKTILAAVLGGTKSDIAHVQPAQTSSRIYLGPQGFTPPAAVPACEGRLAAALPEAAANRPDGVVYLSLYSLLRDHVLPIALKVIPEESQKEIRQIMAVLPPAGANGAIVFATWNEKGASRMLLRITKDEIRNIGMAVNAVIAAQVQTAQ